MRPTASNFDAAKGAESSPLRGPISPIRRWFLRDRSRYEALERRLRKLESACRQQMWVQGHAIEIARSVEETLANTMGSPTGEISRVVETVLRRELDAGLSRNSVLGDLVGGLWENFNQLHAQVQAVAEAVRSESIRVGRIDLKALTESLAATEGKMESKIDEIAQKMEQLSAQSVPPGELVAQMEAKIGEMAQRTEQLSAQSISRGELDATRSRVEFIRRELMYEFRSALLDYGRPNGPPVTAKIINKSKVVHALGRGMLRLNIGCGHIPIDEYVNVDVRELPGVDVIADVTDLPFDDGAVAEIYSSHLLEHFSEEILRRVVLPHWRKKLGPGGLLRTIVPDAEAMIKDYIAGEMSFQDLRDVTFGGQDYSGDCHYTMCTSDHIHYLLHDLGFEELVVTAQGRTNGTCRELEIVGVRAK